MANKPMRQPTLFLFAASALLSSAAQAEDRIAVQTYRYAEGDGRMQVRATSVDVDKDVGVNWSGNLHLGTDAISGATPCWKAIPGYANAYASDLCEVAHETRQSLGSALTWRDAQRNEYRFGFAHSSEPDFVSREWSAQAKLWQDADHNRAYSVGLGLQDNTSVATANTNNRRNANNRAWNLSASLQQVLNRNSTLEASIHAGRDTGYLSNHYLKIVRDDGAGQQVLSDDTRPSLRQNAGLSLRWIAAWSALPLKTHLWYRHDRDNWGVVSHTLEAKAYWDISERWRLSPVLRYLEQSRANFYRGYGDAVNTFASVGPGSNDARLGAMRTATAQLHMQYQLDTHWSLHAGSAYYRQSTGLHAHWLTAGLSLKL
jgi:hypothetical protein